MRSFGALFFTFKSHNRTNNFNLWFNSRCFASKQIACHYLIFNGFS